MTEPFEPGPTDTLTGLVTPTEAQVVELLRTALRDVTRLEQVPSRRGETRQLRAAANAIERALAELEPLV